MIRTPMGDKKYWTESIESYQRIIKDKRENLKLISKNPVYEAEYVFSLSEKYARLLITNYSSGTLIPELSQHFPGLLDAWELSNRLSDEICAKENLTTCRDWDFSLSNLNHYNWCFWLVGLALTLEIPDSQWQRLLALNEVFVGHRTHQSARYRLRHAGREERHSSSGMVVSTGTGATGWARSIQLARGGTLALPLPADPRIAFLVREAFPSVATGTSLVEGLLGGAEILEVTSEMNDGGTLFGDGIESDRIDFGWGLRARIGVARERLRLVR